MFFSLDNLRGNAVTQIEKPQDIVLKDVPYPTKAEDKNKFITWCNAPTTKHYFISMFEGMSPDLRTTKGENGNPVFTMHGVIADYDSKTFDEMKNHVMKTCPSHYLPTHLSHTMSGNCRLIWQFETPLILASETLAKKVLVVIMKEMAISKWAAGLDTGAFSDPSQYYEIGTKWEELYPDDHIPCGITESWLLEAAKSYDFTNKKINYEIPLDDVSEEMHKRFPGKWRGNLFLSARGVRFWDPSADNPTGAVIFADGVYCFTGNKAFMSWTDIFGKSFTDPYKSAYIENAVTGTSYDGNAFWVMDDCDYWIQCGKEDFAQDLRVRGFSGTKGRGETASEIDTIENTIKKTRRVTKSLPFLYHPTGIINYKGRKFMNTSHVRCMEPAPPFMDHTPKSFEDCKDHIPFIYKVIVNMFSETGDSDDIQVRYILAWIAHAYRSGYELNPMAGAAIVLAGDAGKGKTLLSRGIIGAIMGSFVDASSHLVDGSQWTDQLATAGVMAIDDAIATANHQDNMKFTQRVKRYIANSMISYNAKYGQTGEVPWFGRIIITCNNDMESAQIIPAMDVSTRDKIMLFKASKVTTNFGTWKEIDDILKIELPKLCRFLLDWTIPDECIADSKRFGIKAYHNKELFEEALHNSADSITTETLTAFLDEYFMSNPKKLTWIGASINLHAQMSIQFESIMRSVKPRQLATCLGKLHKAGMHMSQERKKGQRVWEIPRSFLEQQYGTVALEEGK
jgi:hypothetical protein